MSRVQVPFWIEGISCLMLILATLDAHASEGAEGGNSGQIVGMVVNGSQGDRPVAGASVLLRAGDELGLMPLAETVTDESGTFRFEGLPADQQLVYLPGANRDDIHYPGPRVRLSAAVPRQMVRVTVFDSAAEPNPLRARAHHMVVRAETGLLKISETLLISNPGTYSYVGKPGVNDAEPATLRLQIPSDFLKVTFDEEFYGRQFHVVDGALQTEIPWTPGERSIRFTYYLPFEHGKLDLLRTLDLPCDDVRVSVYGLGADRVHCNLSRAESDGADGIVYRSADRALPAGYRVTVSLGGLPLPFMAYARWGAAGLLVVMISLTAVAQHRGWRVRDLPLRWRRLSASH